MLNYSSTTFCHISFDEQVNLVSGVRDSLKHVATKMGEFGTIEEMKKELKEVKGSTKEIAKKVSEVKVSEKEVREIIQTFVEEKGARGLKGNQTEEASAEGVADYPNLESFQKEVLSQFSGSNLEISASIVAKSCITGVLSRQMIVFGCENLANRLVAAINPGRCTRVCAESTWEDSSWLENLKETGKGTVLSIVDFDRAFPELYLRPVLMGSAPPLATVGVAAKDSLRVFPSPYFLGSIVDISPALCGFDVPKGNPQPSICRLTSVDIEKWARESRANREVATKVLDEVWGSCPELSEQAPDVKEDLLSYIEIGSSLMELGELKFSVVSTKVLPILLCLRGGTDRCWELVEQIEEVFEGSRKALRTYLRLNETLGEESAEKDAVQ